MLLALLALLTLLNPAAADHSVCSWTGPGPADPTQYGFKLWGLASRVVISPDNPALPRRAMYVCQDSVVADWNFLRVGSAGSSVLELATACNSGGFAEDDGGCPRDYWSYCLTNDSSMKSLGNCFFLTGFNDCEWPGNFTLNTLPAYIAVLAK